MCLSQKMLYISISESSLIDELTLIDVIGELSEKPSYGYFHYDIDFQKVGK